MHALAALLLLSSAASAQTLKIEKTDPIGRRIENEFFIADLSKRIVNGREEDSGTLRALTYKPFGVTFFRAAASGRMHKGPSIQRAGAPGYKDIGVWQPIQMFREEQKDGLYIHHREGYFADYPEVKMEVEYRFPAGAPYFVVMSQMTVEKPLRVSLVRNNEMTMNLFFTHVAWPGRDGKFHIATFDDRRPLLEKDPIAADAPWMAFLNLEKGYGYGYVMLDYKATKTANADITISDGFLSRSESAEGQAKVINARYWSRHIIVGKEMDLVPGDQFREVSAYVLFHCSKDKPVNELLDWAKKIHASRSTNSSVGGSR